MISTKNNNESTRIIGSSAYKEKRYEVLRSGNQGSCKPV